ncbi:MAG: ABC transporter ATP-binding protein [Clostridia bacterium]|nr:ABC transporter ATP-binding protein [Clostridia bacterium]MCL6521325.1 ABC transporter ATP-binding protein [Bacillota bacterium]
MLAVRGLAVRYGHIQALRGVDVELQPGEIVAVLGANGAGKTTLLRSISGLVRPAEGEVRLGEELLAAPRGGRPAHQIVRLGVAHVPEGRQVFATLTVDENLTLGAYTRRQEPARVEAGRRRVFELFPRLAERRGQLAGTLSGGEQQMLAIGRALMAEPRILLLDEPSLGLSPLLVRTIFRTLREINAQGVAMLLVEQNARAALQLAHRAYVLENGRVVLGGKAAELARDDRVRRAYLGQRG